MKCRTKMVLASVLAAVGLTVVAEPVRPAMTTAKPGAAKPAGWLLDRARAARDGFTGHMDEVDEHFRLAWTTNCMRRGVSLGWPNKHQGSWSAEGGTYWFDGLVKLAFQLNDAGLKAQAKRRLDTLLDHVDGKSIGFLWWMDRNDPAQVEEAFKQGRWRIFWLLGMAERPLSAWYEATGDERVPRVLKNVFGWEKLGKCQLAVSGFVDAHRLTGDAEIAKTTDAVVKSFREQNAYMKKPWPGLEESLYLKRYHANKLGLPSRHGVYACEALLSCLRAYQWTGDTNLLANVTSWFGFFDRYCGQPYGVTMMDEEWGWSGVARGTETCDVAAEGFCREQMLAVLGDGKWGDDAERAFFNAGPACVSRDFTRHAYFQTPNRTCVKGCSRLFSCGGDEHTKYGRSVWPLCCTAALNRILPNYVWHMWLKTEDGGVAAALYGPSTFTADLPCGRVAFAEKTNYPFDESIELAVTEAPGTEFPFKLRLPGWCAAPEVAVNGEKTALRAERGFATIRRAWKKGDVVSLRFPMAPRFADVRDMNDFGRRRRAVVMGPLLFAHCIGSDDDNVPRVEAREPRLRESLKPSEVKVVRGSFPKVWDWPENSPLRLETVDADGNALSLVPYGCTKLRISMFGLE